MIMMKTAILSMALGMGFLFSYPSVAGAQNLDAGYLQNVANTGAVVHSEEQLPEIIGSIIKVIIGLLGIIFLVLTIYAGIIWMTAAGDAKKVDKAKGILSTAVIGLVIILCSFAITEFIISNLTATGGTATGPEEFCTVVNGVGSCF